MALAASVLLVPAMVHAGARPLAFDTPARMNGEREVAIFYYPWFGTPTRDGGWEHWDQGGALPPQSVASTFYPSRGPYSSSDASVTADHMAEIAAAGIDTVVVSWWGRGSQEDRRLPAVIEAARARDLAVAAHVEPYAGRTAATVGEDVDHLRRLGIRDVYIWASTWIRDADWADLNGKLDAAVRLFANTAYPGKAKAGGFDGLYTYDVLLYDGRLFPRMCENARRLKLACAPSVGPGYDARRATPDTRVKSRRSGQTYDGMWYGAVRARADVVTITSYNEWHEGTQIEPAKAVGGSYASYDGAWGSRGADAERAYLDRTAHWTRVFRQAPPLTRRAR